MDEIQGNAAAEAELFRVATHEAGHAIVALRLRVAIHSVSIAPDGGSRGRVGHHGAARRSGRAFVWRGKGFIACDAVDAERTATICFGGFASEVLLLGGAEPHGCSQDFEDARLALEPHTGALGGDMAAIFGRLQLRSARLLSAHAADVKALRSALLERTTLTGREVRRVLADAARWTSDRPA
jgi:ATP-dependent Zn protease